MKQLSLIILVLWMGITSTLSSMQSSSSFSSLQKRTYDQSNKGYTQYAQVNLGPSKTTIEYLSDSDDDSSNYSSDSDDSDDDSATDSTQEENPRIKRVRFNPHKKVTSVTRHPQSSLVSPYLQKARKELEHWKNIIRQLQDAIEDDKPFVVQNIVDKMGILRNGKLRRIHVDSIKLAGLPLSPLGFAASLGNLETVQMLLDLGADVNHLDQDNRTALDCAAWNNQSASLHMLLGVETLNQEHIQSALTAIQEYQTNEDQIDGSIIQALTEKLQTKQN